ncbi:MAG: hypothetical protein ABEJ04_00585 [Halobacteriaceae archaeon]
MRDDPHRAAPGSAADAFALLGDETRVAIVLSLGDVGGAAGEALSFSELRDAVGARDSGRFNYHLDRLVGTFVEDAGEGYRLTYAGFLLYQAATRGTVGDLALPDRLETSVACPTCEGDLAAVPHSNGFLSVACGDCDRVLYRSGFPPRGVAVRDGDALLAAVDAWMRERLSLFDRGLCYGCSGRVTRALLTDAASFPPAVRDREETFAFVHYVCRGCGLSPVVDVATVALFRPATVAFLHERGVDARELPFWEFDRRATTEVGDGRATLTVEEGGDALELVFDADGEVASTRRVAP